MPPGTQAAEKCLKARLEEAAIHFPKTHDLESLLQAEVQRARPSIPLFSAASCSNKDFFYRSTQSLPIGGLFKRTMGSLRNQKSGVRNPTSNIQNLSSPRLLCDLRASAAPSSPLSPRNEEF
jgi:hypothetical protein